jgi:hypothetical protein
LVAEDKMRKKYLLPYAFHHSVHETSGPGKQFRDAALGHPEAREELVVERGGLRAGDVGAVDRREDIVNIHGNRD